MFVLNSSENFFAQKKLRLFAVLVDEANLVAIKNDRVLFSRFIGVVNERIRRIRSGESFAIIGIHRAKLGTGDQRENFKSFHFVSFQLIYSV